MTVTMPERLAFKGGAIKGHLIAPIGPDDLVVSADVLTDWPDGSDGRFQAVIGRTLPNEEKVLCVLRSGAILTIAVRGWDGTAKVGHAATETIEHVHTAHDADEANAHGSKVYGHGIASDDAVVGARKSQTLRNKTIDGSLNTLSNIPESASPELVDHIAAVEDDLAAETTARANADTAEATARADADAAHLAALDPHPQYLTLAEGDAAFLTQAEADALYATARTDTGWVTVTTGFTAAGFTVGSGWSLNNVRYRKISSGALSLVEIIVDFQKGAGTISAPNTTGNITDSTILTIGTGPGLRPAADTQVSGPCGAGRVVGGKINSAGVLTIGAVGGTLDISSPERFTVHGFYIQ